MRHLPLALALLLAPPALAGGGPLDVLVVYNADEPLAVAVAEHYREARSLPPGQLCGLGGIDPTAQTIDFVDYETDILEPVEQCLVALPDPDEIDTLVLVRGLPYKVSLDGGSGYSASLQAVLQVFRATRTFDAAPLAGEPQGLSSGYHAASFDNPAYRGGYCSSSDLTVSNPYAGWYTSACQAVRVDEQPPAFVRAGAGSAGGYDFADNLFIVSRLDGFDYDDAHDLIDRALSAERGPGTGELLCLAAADEARGARDPECEFAVRQLGLLDATLGASWQGTYDGGLSGHSLHALFTGSSNFRGGIDGNTFLPGAMVDNLTSYGAVPNNFFCTTDGLTCPSSESQTSIARFVRAGATTVHGTVAEPLNNPFPNAGALIHYTMGYSAGESWLFNQRFLYWQSIYLGDPLTTPWVERPTVTFGESSPDDDRAVEVSATHPSGTITSLVLVADGVVIDSADAAQATFDLPGDEGDTVQLLAIAWLADAEHDTTGWPVDSQLWQPSVQGWASLDLTLGPIAEDPDPDDTADPDDGDCVGDCEGDGCGCEVVPSPLTAWWLLGPALLVLRRRTADASTKED